MLTINQIKEAVTRLAKDYPIKSVQLFGSYANGCETESSDVDILVEFLHEPVSLLKFFGFQEELSESLGIPVDIVKYPLSEQTKRDLIIERTVQLYGK